MANQVPLKEQEVLSIKPTGLWSYPNLLSAVPQGALREATNVVINRPNVIEQRRGIQNFGTALAGTIKKVFNFQNKLVVHQGSTLSYDSDNLGTWVDYAGSFSAPTNALTIHSIQVNKNIYFTTSAGLQKLDSITGTVKAAGAPAGLDGAGSATGSGWFTNNTQVAYRIVFGYTDANNNLILGAPSQRIVVPNSTGSAATVSLTFTVPAGLSTSYFYQIYRSPMSAGIAVEPNDECALVIESKLTAGNISAGYVTITDNVDDSLKGAMIYTASSQQGISQANYTPPLSTDATYFRGYVMYANTSDIQELYLTLISVSGTGLVADDTITIAGVTYTAKATETIASAQFKVFTAGTPSQNITDTANSLVRVINRYTGNTTVYAYYESGFSEAPGKILIAARSLATAAYTAASSRGGAFVPNLTTAQSSSNNVNPNYVYISKYQQPEAVPFLQYLPVGAADKSILRIIALRDYVLILKQDGVFQITGSDINSFSVSLVDSSVILRGLETAVSLNNKVYLFSSQSVISITFNEGAVLKSLPIKQDLLKLSSSLYPNFDTRSFGVAYESENKYILGTITAAADTAVTQFFVYNYLTDTWTRWEFPLDTLCGFVNPTDDKLYLGTGDADFPYLQQERKNFTTQDYADHASTVYIIAFSGTTVYLNDTSKIAPGAVLQCGGNVAIVKSVDSPGKVTVDRVLTWFSVTDSTIQYIVNGDFSAPLGSEWALTGTVAIVGGGVVGNCLQVNGYNYGGFNFSGYATQTIYTAPGVLYTLDFYHKSGPFAHNDSGDISVDNLYSANITSTTWVAGTATFTPLTDSVPVRLKVHGTDPGNYTLFDSVSITSPAASALVYSPIAITVKFVPESCSNPGIVKHFKEVHTVFSTANFPEFTLGYSTDFTPAIVMGILKPKLTGMGYGSPYGSSPYGGGTPAMQVIRGIVPLTQRRGHWLNISVNYAQAFTDFALDGFAIFYQNTSQRFH